jgi:hypothetical protein
MRSCVYVFMPNNNFSSGWERPPEQTHFHFCLLMYINYVTWAKPCKVIWECLLKQTLLLIHFYDLLMPCHRCVNVNLIISFNYLQFFILYDYTDGFNKICNLLCFSILKYFNIIWNYKLDWYKNICKIPNFIDKKF